MPRRLQSRRSPARRQRRKAQPVLVQQDRMGYEMMKQQMLRPMPTQPDVRWIVPKRDKEIHNFYLSASRGAITTSTTIPSAGALTFILQDLPAYTELTALYDQYRIMKVKVEFIVTGATNPLTGPPGLILTALDYNDATTPASVNELVQYETVQSVPVGNYFERTLQPRSAVAAYSGVFTSFANVYAQWIDTASSSVVHYGIKYYIPAIATSVYTISPIAHYHVQCRSLH
jgi:hypothetical protein